MSHFYDLLQDRKLTSMMDEIPLWSAPFGMRILQRVRLKRSMTVLDLGCGTGFPLLELAMRLGPTSRVYGIDPGEPAIVRAQGKIVALGLPNVQVVSGYAERMPFVDHEFDLIVSNNGLNNVCDLAASLDECARVSRAGGQLVFTFNTEETFDTFYAVYRSVVAEQGLGDYDSAITEHIYSKRRPVREMESLICKSGFQLRSIINDEFSYRFSDGTSMFNHFFIKLAFMPSWKEILPKEIRDKVFLRIEELLNIDAQRNNGLEMKVPFVTFDCSYDSI